MSKEKCVDIIEFLKTVRTLSVQVKLLEDLNIPDEQKNIARKALKAFFGTAHENLREDTP